MTHPLLHSSPDVVIVKEAGRDRQVYFDADQAAGAIINAMLDYTERYTTRPPVIVRYTTGELDGGDISEAAAEAFEKLIPRPPHPYPNGVESNGDSIFSRTPPDADARIESWNTKSASWRADSKIMIIARLGLR